MSNVQCSMLNAHLEITWKLDIESWELVIDSVFHCDGCQFITM